jgi:hypothetical protein
MTPRTAAAGARAAIRILFSAFDHIDYRSRYKQEQDNSADYCCHMHLPGVL